MASPRKSGGNSLAPEAALITSLRALAGDPAARKLVDDAAVLEIGGTRLVLTHDMIVEGVHFLSGDPPEDVAWKLVAVNLSDLAAKGARPLGALLGYTLSGDEWDGRFVLGLKEVMDAFGLALLGGDTVSAPAFAARSFGLTAIGQAENSVPSRSGAAAGDLIWVSGTIGDAGAGLRIAIGEIEGPDALLSRYRRPQPRLDLGQRLAPVVSAMMDVSDGLLIDAARLAAASQIGATIELENLPLSGPLVEMLGETRQTRLNAAAAGDDYELLFTAPPVAGDLILEAASIAGVPVSVIGRIGSGAGLSLTEAGAPLPLPERLGFEHGARPA